MLVLDVTTLMTFSQTDGNTTYLLVIHKNCREQTSKIIVVTL